MNDVLQSMGARQQLQPQITEEEQNNPVQPVSGSPNPNIHLPTARQTAELGATATVAQAVVDQSQFTPEQQEALDTNYNAAFVDDPNNSPTFWDSIKNTVTQGWKRDIGLLKAAGSGVLSAVQELGELGSYIQQKALEPFIPKDVEFPGFQQLTIPGSNYQPEDTVGHVVKSATQFLTGFIGAGKIVKGGQRIGSGLKSVATYLGSNASRGAIADFAVFSAEQENLSNLIQSIPLLENPISAYLADKGEDVGEIEGRFKNAVDGLFIGLVADAIFVGVRGIKNRRAAKTLAEQQAVIRETETAIEEILNRPAPLPGEAVGNNGYHPILNQRTASEIINTEGVVEEIAQAAALSDYRAATINPRMNSGRTSEQILDFYDDFVINNKNRLNVDSPEGLETLADQITSIWETTLKSEGRQSHEELVDLAADYMARFGSGFDSDLIAAAKESQEAARDLAVKAVGFGTRVRSNIDKMVALGNKSADLDPIAAAPYTKEMLRLDQENAALLAAVKDINTASARTVSAGKIVRQSEGIINDDYLNALVKSTPDEVQRVRKVAQLYDLASKDITAFRAITEMAHKKIGIDALVSYYVNNLLWSPKTWTINGFGNTLKTILSPGQVILGSGLTHNSSALRQGIGMYIGMFSDFRNTLKSAWTVSKTGKSILDPDHLPIDAYQESLTTTIGKLRAAWISLKGNNPLFPMAPEAAAQISSQENVVIHALSYLSQVQGIPGRLLQTTDELFKRMNYNSIAYGHFLDEAWQKGIRRPRDIAEYVKGSMANLMEPTAPEAMKALEQQFIQWARRQTWTQDVLGGLAQGVGNLRNQSTTAKLIIPFYRTPVNLLSDSIQHIPILHLFSKEMRNDLTSGRPELVALARGKLATGMMIASSMWWAANEGRLTGALPTDPLKREAWRANGIKPYSIRAGNTYVSYAQVEPFASLLGLVADLHEGYESLDENGVEYVSNRVVASITNNITNKSYLQGLSDTLNVLTDADLESNRVSEFFARQTASILPGGSLNRFIRSQTDPIMREARGFLDTLANQLPDQYPGFRGSTQLPPRINWLTGEPNDNQVWFSKWNDNPVVEELILMSESVGISSPPRTLKGVELTAEEYSRLCELMGSTKLGGYNLIEALGRTFALPAYDINRERVPDLPNDVDSVRAELIRATIEPYRKYAQQQLLIEFPEIRQEGYTRTLRNAAGLAGDAERVDTLTNLLQR